MNKNSELFQKLNEAGICPICGKHTPDEKRRHAGIFGGWVCSVCNGSRVETISKIGYVDLRRY